MPEVQDEGVQDRERLETDPGISSGWTSFAPSTSQPNTILCSLSAESEVEGCYVHDSGEVLPLVWGMSLYG